MTTVTTKVVSVNTDGTTTPKRNKKRERHATMYNMMKEAFKNNTWVTREALAAAINSTVGSINVTLSGMRSDDDTVVIERSKEGYRMREKNPS